MNADRVKPASDVDFLEGDFAGVGCEVVDLFFFKEGFDGLVVECSRSDDNFEIFSFNEDDFQEAEQNLIINGPFVDIIQDDNRELIEQRIRVEFLDQDSISHEGYSSLLVNSGVEPDLVGNLSIVETHFITDSFSDREGGDFSGEDDCDFFVGEGVPCLDQELWEF